MSFMLNVAKIGLVVQKFKGDAVMGRISEVHFIPYAQEGKQGKENFLQSACSLQLVWRGNSCGFIELPSCCYSTGMHVQGDSMHTSLQAFVVKEREGEEEKNKRNRSRKNTRKK